MTLTTLMALLLAQLAVRWQPNNSLKLTGRAGPWGGAPGPPARGTISGCLAASAGQLSSRPLGNQVTRTWPLTEALRRLPAVPARSDESDIPLGESERRGAFRVA
jgi:hypothetical protein